MWKVGILCVILVLNVKIEIWENHLQFLIIQSMESYIRVLDDLC